MGSFPSHLPAPTTPIADRTSPVLARDLAGEPLAETNDAEVSKGSYYIPLALEGLGESASRGRS
jgi:hypothetical protein